MNLFITVIVVLSVLLLAFAYDFSNTNADYMILLGAGLKNDDASFTMINRVNRASLYLQKNRKCKVIVSGGVVGNNHISEASVMNDLLDERHIHTSRIIIEDKSHNTIENIKNSIKLIDSNSKIVICSSDYHLFRAKLIGLRLGINARTLSCRTFPIELIWRIPLEYIFIIKNMIEM